MNKKKEKQSSLWEISTKMPGKKIKRTRHVNLAVNPDYDNLELYIDGQMILCASSNQMTILYEDGLYKLGFDEIDYDELS